MARSFDEMLALSSSRSSPAMVYEDGRSVDLTRAVSRLMAALKGVGVERRVAVGFVAPQRRPGGLEVAAMVACLRLGAVWCPGSDGTRAWISESDDGIELWPGMWCRVWGSEGPTVLRYPDDALYVVPTSGTSSKRVGVAGSKAATLRRLEWAWTRFPGPGVVLRRTPIGFVDSIAEILGTVLSNDLQLCIPLSHAVPPQVSRLTVTPSILDVMLTTNAITPRDDLLVFCSGEALSKRLRLRFAKALPRAQLVNVYGAAETTADATYAILEPPDLRENCCDTCLATPTSPIGGPLLPEKISVDVVNGLLRVQNCSALGYVLPQDEDGDVHIVPGKSSKERRTFIGGDVVETGDLGSRCACCGAFRCDGRNDDEINVLGVKVNLKELEAKYGGVAVVEGSGPTARIVLYTDTQEEVPPYCVVRRLHGDVPRGPTGKVNKRLVPVHAGLSDIFADILGHHDGSTSFKEQGGTSLTAIQALHFIQQRFSTNLLTVDDVLHLDFPDLLERVVDDTSSTRTTKRRRPESPSSSNAPVDVVVVVVEKPSGEDKLRIWSRDVVPEDVATTKQSTEVKLKRRWSTKLGKCVDAPPLVVVDGEEITVYIGSHAKRFVAVDETGAIRWEQRIGDDGDQANTKSDASIEAGACVVGDLVIVGAYDGVLYGLHRKDGRRMWTFRVGGEIKNAAVPFGTSVVFGSHDHRIRCVENGDLAWTSADLGGAIFGTPAVTKKNLVLGATTNGSVVALDSSTGAVRWRIDARAPVFAPLTVLGDRVFYGTVTGGHASLDLDTGKSIWGFTTKGGVFAKPCSADSVIFAAIDGVVLSRNPKSGARLWATNVDAPVFATPALLPGLLVVATTSGRLLVLGISDGRPRAALDLGAPVYSSPVALNVDGRVRIFLGSRDDSLNAIDLLLG